MFYFVSKKRNEIEQKMMDFVEGRMGLVEFVQLYTSDSNLIKYVEKEAKKTNSWYYNLEETKKLDFTKLNIRSGFATTILNYLLKRKKSIGKLNSDICTYRKYSRYLPSWLNFDKEGVIMNIITSHENNESAQLNTKNIKDIIASQFKYKDKPPRWLQSSEWPIIEGKPCFFVSQDGDPDDLTKDIIRYYFIDKSTNREIIITQMV